MANIFSLSIVIPTTYCCDYGYSTSNSKSYNVSLKGRLTELHNCFQGLGDVHGIFPLREVDLLNQPYPLNNVVVGRNKYIQLACIVYIDKCAMVCIHWCISNTKYYMFITKAQCFARL